MLKAPNRLTKDRDIEAVYKRGRSFYMGDLALRLAPNKLPAARLAVIVSLKVSKKAVKRNLLKRRLREIIRREVIPHCPNGFDGIILTKAGLLNLPFTELKSQTLRLFKKAGLI